MKHWLTAIAKCWFTIAALALTGTVYAQTYTITSLTNNNNNDGYFQFVNNGDVVWSGYNGTNWDLYKYDATSNTTTQMTNTTGADEYATGLNSRNDILWTQVNVLPTSTSTDLILLDGTTQTTTKLNATPICASSPNLLNDNGDVIWMESDTPPQTITTCDVYYYQASTHTTMNVSNNTLGDNFPNFYPGGNIIWTHDTGPIGSGAPTHVLLYNVANATVTDMTASYGVNGMQSWNAHGDIVWSGNDPSGTDTVIYRYDATSRTVAQITPVDGLTDAYPVAGPTGDVIWAKGTDLYYYYAATGVTMYVARGPWVGSGNFMANGDVIFLSTDATNTYNEVYVYKVATGQLVDISNTPTNVKWWYWFNTNGDITWRMGGSGADPAGGDIFVYQAATGTVDRLTNDTLEDNVPVINDKGEVVWIHFDGNDYEINKAVPQSAIPTVTLSASPTSVASGGSSTLTWSSTDATSCTASGGWTGAKDISGTLAVTVSATTIYTLACTGTGGTTTQSVTVTVVPAPTLTFTATPASIAPGGNSSLSWSTTNADSCTASDGWTGNKSTAGTETVTPAATTTYTLSCSGTGGTVTSSATVTVAVAAYSLVATPTVVARGGVVSVTWSTPTTQNSTSDWIGLYRVGAANTNYLAYQYTNGAQTGTKNFRIRMLPRGTYEFRYLLNNGYTSITTSNTITVR